MDTALARSPLGSTPGFIKGTNERLRERALRSSIQAWSQTRTHVCGGAATIVLISGGGSILVL